MFATSMCVMSSIFSGTEKHRPAQREPAPIPRLQCSTVLWVLGVMLLFFGLFLVPLISADLRLGHRFWLQLVIADEVVAIGLIAAGGVFKALGRNSLQ